MKLNWNFLREGGGGAKQKPSIGGVWTFSGTAHCKLQEKIASHTSAHL